MKDFIKILQTQPLIVIKNELNINERQARQFKQTGHIKVDIHCLPDLLTSRKWENSPLLSSLK